MRPPWSPPVLLRAFLRFFEFLKILNFQNNTFQNLDFGKKRKCPTRIVKNATKTSYTTGVRFRNMATFKNANFPPIAVQFAHLINFVKIDVFLICFLNCPQTKFKKLLS